MHSVKIELAKLVLVGTRITYQATGDAGCSEKIILRSREWSSTKKTYPSGTATTTRHTTASNTIIGWNLYEYVG